MERFIPLLIFYQWIMSEAELLNFKMKCSTFKKKKKTFLNSSLILRRFPVLKPDDPFVGSLLV